jgi:predicted nucleotidyltransferase
VTSLDSATRQSIIDALKVVPDIRFGIVFGSFAFGKPLETSDLDIAVTAGRCLTAVEKIALISELAARLGRAVDLVDLCSAGEPLLGQILKHGIPILGGKADHAALIRRHVFDTADFAPYRRRILDERRRAWIRK